MKQRITPEFVPVLKEMTREERWRFFVKYIDRYGTEIGKARRTRKLVEDLFDSGCCPHCKTPLL